MQQKKTTLTFRVIKWLIYLFYPKTTVEGAAYLPTDEPCVVVGNHAQLHGPLMCELHFPISRYTWCAGEMMQLREVPAYAYRDFWSGKPRGVRWVYKLLSYMIAPLSVCLFNNANTIGVYHDMRSLSTFRTSVKYLQEGESIVIFPEYNVPNTPIVYEFQEKFIDVARLYYKKTGKELLFVPLYVAPKLHKLCLGEPIRFRAEAPIDEERARLCAALSESITQLAYAQPRHTVVPYPNLPKRQYPENKPAKEDGV